MTTPDYIVLLIYFAVMALIGLISMLKIKRQEDFFMGGRSFGKLLQAFAAFGAGTGSSDPINTARTTFTSGLSGMWSIMSWLFVTPFYWITGVWYRRMRYLTLGDWFVDRYESRSLGAAYTLFGLLFYIVYTAMLFTAIGKFASPLMGDTLVIAGHTLNIEYVLVPIIAVIVIVYGVLGGLTAAYWTDLIQGVFIILLSVLLIPFGLLALVEKFGNPADGTFADGLRAMSDGLRIMHERVPAGLFEIVGSSDASEFPIYRIVAVVVILLVGVVVMPHFIATGGGSAKSETTARVGLVAGNFAKRFCTIGWAMTALIILALMADNPDLAEDPDKVWGIASLELFGPGLRGLMLACLLAALMSSADCYMIVCSALVVRNLYAPYVNPEASEREYVTVGRITGIFMIVGAVLMSWYSMDVFKQLQLTWIVPMLFAAPFWVGMYWRRATTTAAWGTLLFAAIVLFAAPHLAPLAMPELRTMAAYTTTNDVVVTTTTRPAMPTDVAGRDAEIELWHRKIRDWISEGHSQTEEAAIAQFGPCPEAIFDGDEITKKSTRGGKAVFWSGGVRAIDENGDETPGVKPRPIGDPVQIDEHTTRVVMRYPDATRLEGLGSFNVDFLLYDLAGMDLRAQPTAMLETLELPPKIILPFVVMILLSLVTRRNSTAALDRLYVKMKTPVVPDPELDRAELEKSYADPHRFDHRKLFPHGNLEIQKPTAADAIGFITCVAICFLIIWLVVWVAGLGG
ncbi:MAG: sodium:solute symporter family protein [Thermoguttaceae bacterium]